jgi:lipopolysaccharide transport system ATP-binding protein
LSENNTDKITVHTPLVIEFDVWNQRAGLQFHCGFNLHNEYGIHVLSTGTVERRSYPAGLIRFSGQIPGDLLNVGVHRIEFFVLQSETEVILVCPDVLAFEVNDSLLLRSDFYGEWPGAVRPNIQWTTEVME